MPAITFTHSSVCPRTSERKLLEFSLWATAYGVGLRLPPPVGAGLARACGAGDTKQCNTNAAGRGHWDRSSNVGAMILLGVGAGSC
jgi:hypothetical protein